jgi:sterol desaturase/sphingolipid hydroxylase (fatty acid hydroxylase superfamily)
VTHAERIFSVTVFPAVLAGSIAALLHLIETGRPPLESLGPLIFATGLVVFGLERVFPYHRSWLHSKGDLGPDLGYALGVGTLVAVAVTPVVAVVGLAALGWLSERFGADLWPTAWPLLAQLPLALVVAELPKYWHHRLQHNIDFLWRFHATHHSAPRLYWLNAARFHPVDIFTDGLLGGVTLVALGCQIEVVALFTLVSGVHGFFQHANLPIRCGPLNYFFSMAELHRWHHSKVMQEANHNYGQNVIVWDLVFGTFFWPKDREPPEDIGIPDLPAFPMTFWRQLASPFSWRRIVRESAASSP